MTTNYYTETDRPFLRATLFKTADGKIEVSALIRGDGVDLVQRRPGCKPTTLQLTIDEARETAQALLAAANESASDA